ncbi:MULTISPECIES: 3-deoxy-7-phosphoheptulonate synthase [unclassified Streptomyces]|uniref:3-deoxy-7-phosphoheptulonate synthase n=1 Tax=unclassified Streptomyces TaxID=2593676 RepID=UPI000DD85A0F|nr:MULTISPECIES: 3-deoxy-7-phosphoheptulonate synthase [unclassified Streptomyces]QZZ29984.1 3-deoxy-7-phosphoheptulonate synthase [Streptomyces sp. ST1015]
MDNTLLDIRLKPARQQPAWDDLEQLERVRDELVRRPALVTGADVRALRAALAEVAAGNALVVQAGDCAEDPDECTVAHVARKTAVLDLLAGAVKMIAHRPVVRIGRIAGQFAKPRSNDTETVDGVELPVFRGHMVNSPEFEKDGRRPDPLRLLTGYMAAAEIMEHLGRRAGIEPPVWTSHEALLLDYEIPMLRRDREGRLLLASTHMPWIGERTRQVDGAHVALLAEVVNPVACKVGPKMSVPELLALCEKLDPEREPGRLTLIARMGAGTVADVLPALVAAVRSAGHPVSWLSDPMHGNTVTTPDGVKTRHTETVEREITAFQEAVRSAGGVAGGLHLETTPDDVVECVANSGCSTGRYTSHCDPRLNPGQAVAVASAWHPAK